MVYLLVHLVLQPVRVDGDSMFPDLHNGDYLISTPVPFWFGKPEPGEIVIVKNPLDPSQNLVKRIIAVPGDRLSIRDGRVYIDGELLREPYLSDEPPWVERNDYPLSASSIVLGPHDYFVMGDNRNVSLDSRFFGPVPRSDIEAEVVFRVWPLTEIGQLSTAHPTLVRLPS